MNTPNLRNLYIRLLRRENDAASMAMARDFLRPLVDLPQASPMFPERAGISAIPPFAKGGREGLNAVDLSDAEPSPSGRGQGEGCLKSLHPNLLPEGEGTQRLKSTALRGGELYQYAPTALLQWDWLRSISHTAAGHRSANAALFAAYLDAVGLDNPAQSLAAQYRALLVQAGVHLPALGCLINDPDLPPAILTAPCIALCLSHLPTERFGEILGYTLAHCQESHVWLDWLEQRLPQQGLPINYCLTHRALIAKHQTALLAVQAGYGDTPSIATGYALYCYGLQTFFAALNTASESQAEAMLRRKLPYALGHHGRIRLQDKTLDQWLADGDLVKLRLALQQSPDVSKRLWQSMPFGGAMFGVFSVEEQDLLRVWLELSPSPSGESEARGAKPVGVRVNGVCKNQQRIDVSEAFALTLPSHGSLNYSDCVGGFPPRRGYPPELSFSSNPLRELYHQLLNRESYPDSLTTAAVYAETVLSRTQLLAPLQIGLKRRFSYEPEVFKNRIDAIYHQEMARYRPLIGAPKLPRELFLWGIEQMAPAILLDGCWLENLAGAEPAQDEVQRRLLQTFADEVGYGNSEHNHPNVYRRLLQSLDIALPSATSQEFAQHPQLCDAAFVLPTYLLAIGAWPERYYPEILGLNLAIELSGLGASYMQLIDALRYYQIDAYIIQLHLSIDNLANGHAALARDAIALYLDRIDRSAIEPVWQRIWTGYLSLTAASIPFAWAGFSRYGRWRLHSCLEKLSSKFA